MDSETLVSNVFHKSNQGVIGEVLKKNSIIEKLTSVKNKMCERLGRMSRDRLDNERMRRLKKLLDSAEKLRYEAKLIDLDRARHRIEVRKRMQPGGDFSYQDAQIQKREKSLGLHFVSCYLDRRQRHPLRFSSAPGKCLTANMSKARTSLRMREIQKSEEENLTTSITFLSRGKTKTTSETLPAMDQRYRSLTSATPAAISTIGNSIQCDLSSYSFSQTNFLFDNIGKTRTERGKLGQSHSNQDEPNDQNSIKTKSDFCKSGMNKKCNSSSSVDKERNSNFDIVKERNGNVDLVTVRNSNFSYDKHDYRISGKYKLGNSTYTKDKLDTCSSNCNKINRRNSIKYNINSFSYLNDKRDNFISKKETLDKCNHYKNNIYKPNSSYETQDEYDFDKLDPKTLVKEEQDINSSSTFMGVCNSRKDSQKKHTDIGEFDSRKDSQEKHMGIGAYNFWKGRQENHTDIGVCNSRKGSQEKQNFYRKYTLNKYKSNHKLLEDNLYPDHYSITTSTDTKTARLHFANYETVNEHTINLMKELSSEDLESTPEYVDLRDHFFDCSSKSTQKTSRSTDFNHIINEQVVKMKQRQHTWPELVLDALKVEANFINNKVRKFLKHLEVLQHKVDTTEIPVLQLPPHGQNCDNNVNFVTNKTKHCPENLLPLIKSATMPNFNNPNVSDQSVSNEDFKNIDPEKLEETEDVKAMTGSPKKIKYSWKHIRNRPADGHLRGDYTAEDLVLQALTGIPIRNVLQAPVLLHAASRAMRHTATFKMRKIVEERIKNRTKYQKHAVEVLKKEMVKVLKQHEKAENENVATGEGGALGYAESGITEPQDAEIGPGTKNRLLIC